MNLQTLAPVAFLLGAALGWIAKPDSGSFEGSMADDPPLSLDRAAPQPAQSNPSLDASRVRELLKDWNGFSNDNPDLPDFDAADYPGLLGAMRRQAGLTGLDHNARSLFGKLLANWYAKDPAGATEWVRNLPLPEDRATLGEVLAAAAARNDFDRALSLVDEFCRDSAGTVTIPSAVMKLAIERGADTLVRTLSHSVSKGGSSGSTFEYPRDFEFSTALDGIADLVESGVQLGTMPTNLLDEWAQRDPAAAFGWIAKGRKIPFGFDISSYFLSLDSPDKVASTIALIDATGDQATPLYRKMASEIQDAQTEHLIAAISNSPMVWTG